MKIKNYKENPEWKGSQVDVYLARMQQTLNPLYFPARKAYQWIRDHSGAAVNCFDFGCGFVRCPFSVLGLIP